jgi:hypothetical protein
MRPLAPASLSPSQRRLEIARLLAAGVRRLRASAEPPDTPAPEESENPGDSRQNSLEVLPETRLSVHNG